MDKDYDQAALIQAYIASEKNHGHEDFTRFYAARLAALEQAFKLKLTYEGIKKQENDGLWHLFPRTVWSYVRIYTPGDFMLESGIIAYHLEQLAEQAAPLQAAWQTIRNAAHTSRQAHLVMLNELFELLWGKTSTIVTSTQLREQGFDDSQEPNWMDYE